MISGDFSQLVYSIRQDIIENTTLPTRQNGTYELRIKYKGKTVVFFYDGKTMTSSVK